MGEFWWDFIPTLSFLITEEQDKPIFSIAYLETLRLL